MPSLHSKLSDPVFQGRVKPITWNRYCSALLQFTTWASDEGLMPTSPAEWDDALLEYRYATSHLSKSKFANLVSALELMLPPLKRSLPWSHALLAGWGRVGHTRHTVPMTRKPAYLVAIHMSSRRKTRLGLGLITQVLTGMRPSEMLKILPEHIQFPDEYGDTSAQAPVVIALGVKHGTKSKRSQVVLLRPHLSHLLEALRCCRDNTPEGHFMFPYTLAAYRMEIQAIEAILGTNLGWGPHSPRAGFATDAKMDGEDFIAIREAGRWLSDESLRTYLDVLSSTMVIKSLRLRGLSNKLAAAERLWPAYFGVSP